MAKFLATTALPEFWDKGADTIFFLGKWCTRYDRQDDWKNLNYLILPYPWDDRDAMHHASKYEEEICERLLKTMAEYMNETHGEKHTLDYWRVILLPWLVHYIYIMHERYLCLQLAYQRYPDLETICLHPDSFNTPRYYTDFILGSTDDPYNLQIYSSILHALGIKSELREMPWDWASSVSISPPSESSAWMKLRIILRRTVQNIMLRWALGGKILLADMYIPYTALLKITYLTKTSARPALLPSIDDISSLESSKYNSARKDLSEIAISTNDEFNRVLVKALPHHLPLIYLEGYDDCRRWVCEIQKRSQVRTYISSNALLTDEVFKFLYAQGKEDGAQGIAVQHGGCYGAAQYNPLERCERSVTDEFWSWGWGGGEESVRPVPSLKLSFHLKKRTNKNIKHNPYMLFVGNISPRYHYRTWSCPTAGQIENYLNWQIQFLSLLEPQSYNKLIFRPYIQDFGWGIRQRLLSSFQNLNLSKPGQDYYEEMSGSSLIICDMNQTTLLESLAFNIPTIAFWDPNLWELRANAEEDFERLRQVNILHDSPEAAAKVVNTEWLNIESWWTQDEIQNERTRFVNKYALNSSSWFRNWADTMKY